jgi:predicted ATP-dependent serine protease
MPGHVRGQDSLIYRLLEDVLSKRDANANDVPAGGQVPSHFWVLHGLGGVGKTTVALSVARAAADAGVRVFWVAGEVGTRVGVAMCEVVQRMGATIEDLRENADRLGLIDTVWRYLENSTTSWLLIIDNADNPQYLAAPGFQVNAGNG